MSDTANQLITAENLPAPHWHATHQEAQERLTRMAEALGSGDWKAVDLGAKWIFEVLKPHNEAEERELFPLLEEIGAEALLQRLQEDHRQMWDLDLQLLAEINEGQVRAPRSLTLLGQRLVDLIRDHIEAEEKLMLPLLKGKSLYWSEDETQDGYLILEKKLIAPETWSFIVQAPQVARGRKPGQFFMVAPFPESERIPLTLAGGDAKKGYIHFIMQEVGATTKAMGRLSAGDRFYAVAGPMGTPTELVEEGTIVLMAGGYGSAAILPAAEALHAQGRRVITILGGRSKERVLLADELGAASAELIVTTDDGTLGRQGLVTDALKDVIAREKVAQVVAVGPLPMMRAVSDLTKPHGIFTLVSLNALMVDGTGMCGGCRVSVGGQTKFACFDGPDFDGHQVDFNMLRMRSDWYKQEEKDICEPDQCKIGRVAASGPVDYSKYLNDPVTELDWQNLDLRAIKPSQKMKIPRQEMACQPPELRVCNFDEVSLGLSPEQARLEAARCIMCKHPACIEGCPVSINIPAFLQQIVNEDPQAAARVIKESSSLGSVCGRVCPQEKQCEIKCVVGIKGLPVSIGRLERFACDSMLGSTELPPVEAPTGKKVAVIGAGPAGLTVAGELIKKGHRVTVYDALHKPGGVMLYGIPEFRLPNKIVDQEVETLRRLGVKFVMNTLVGRSMTLDDLRQENDAIFMGTGAGLPKMMGIPGEEYKGVYTANEFLTRINLMRADLFPEFSTPVTVGKNVIIVGAGNTAMDASRAARRMGAEHVTVVYRRTVKESTARKEELEHAQEEGVEFKFLTTPVQLHGNDKGWMTHAECAVMELGEPGPDGRRSPRMTDERIMIPCDTLVVALGFDVNPLIAQTDKGLKTLKGGVVVVDNETGETSLPGVFAGGDVITGGATVILAMGQGRRAAAAIHSRLVGEAQPAV
ncbi:NADPH-dependent glutamate synthase [Geothrix edaphica]|uniref:2-polyprenylphenol hydroxylase n=1 Tax=Geothrix edaphica TaxID=2927976 RepID=A0ABQ5PYB0_9BACT|nr:NADPH-dependent glutamate synthase [Geothrix edaphica]GLH67353.1 2-polyprenylphenol hydroxylase [Geothrix edaphica]